MPPVRFVTALLRGLVDAPFADAVVGDLLEERGRRSRLGHPVRARLWFWRSLAGVLLYSAATVISRSVRRAGHSFLHLDRWHSDVRMAFRSFHDAPATTAVAIAVLTLGIGASTAIFSVVDAVALRGLPFDRSDQLVAVSETMAVATMPHGLVYSPGIFAAWRDAHDVFSGLAAIVSADLNVERDGSLTPVVLRSERVSTSFFDVLHVRPIAGRTFTADDEIDGHDDVAVISYGVWQRRFGGAPVIGHRLRTPDRTFAIVGVMPAGFNYPVAAIDPTDVWTPYVVSAGARDTPGSGAPYSLTVIGRLRDDVSVARAQSRLDQVTAGLAARFPQMFQQDRSALVEPLQGSIVTGVRSWMLVLAGAVACVLLLACANVANLMLVRAGARKHELGVRTALGATRWDIARPLLVESLLLSAAGAALGVLVAFGGVDLLRAAVPASVPRAAAIAVNLRVLAAAGALTIATGVICSLAPMIQFSRPETRELLKDSGRTHTRGSTRWLGPSLIVAEVALAVVLTVGAALFIASFDRVTSVDIGLDVRNVVTVDMHPWPDYSAPPDVMGREAESTRRLERIAAEVAALPGVEGAALFSGFAPLSGATRLMATPFTVPGRQSAHRSILTGFVSPTYFTLLGIPVLRGRPFTLDDADGPPAVILDASAARAYFGSADAAIGQIVQCGACGMAPATIVGVVGDVRPRGPEVPPEAMAYVPFARTRSAAMATLMLRTADVAPIAPAIRRIIWTEFPDLGLPEMRTLADELHTYTAPREFNMLVLGVFGVLGLVIASVGLYGVMAAHVAQRTQEIGIRMALGAQPRRVLRHVVGRAAVYLAAGLVVGLPCAWLLSGLVRAFLFETAPTDLHAYAASAGVLIAAGLLAALAPALRAARVDPIIALRSE
ncbi:MAG TPA: ABC transporter permease [Vicinamibacterales bacterium]|nr:ABC transporter permease [Vicinamibacterales bacterium]